jgi:hypothetical protein
MLINKIKENDSIKQFVQEINPQFRVLLKNLSQESDRLFE